MLQVTIESGKGLTAAWAVKKDGSKVQLEVPAAHSFGGLLLEELAGKAGIVLLAVGVALVLGGLFVLLCGSQAEEQGVDTQKKD